MKSNFWFLLLISLAIITISCGDKFEIPEIDRKSDRLILDFAESVRSMGLSPMGIGGGLDHSIEKINLFSITFSTHINLQTLDQARELLTDTLEMFISYINSREDIREYLAVAPVSIENVDVSIICRDAQPGNIVDISNYKARLYYYTENIAPEGCWETFHKETYEEAKAILEKQRENEI